MDRAGDPRPRAGSALARRRRRRPPRLPHSRFARRLRRSLRPPRTLRPTRAGWCYFALTFGIGFASLNTGNNLLYMVLSVLLAFLVLSGVFSESALRGLRVRRRFPEELHAGHASSVVVEVRNAKKRWPSYAVVVDDLCGIAPDLSEPVGRCFFLQIPPGNAATRIHRWTPERRGEVTFAGFRIWTRFPFGLFVKSLIVEERSTVLVYPAISQAPRAEGNPSERRGESSAGTAGGESPEAVGVRDYAAGDSFRRIHWPHTLRRSALLVRDREHEQHAELVVRLGAARAVPGPAFEAQVVRAASEVVSHLDAGWRVGLRCDDRLIPPAAGPRQRRALLRHLALVRAGAGERGRAA